MRLKQGVRVRGVQPEILLGLAMLEREFDALGHELVVTSLLDGTHKRGSLHYEGLAADIRRRDLSAQECELILRDGRRRLGECFELLLESDHFHLELSPIGLVRVRTA